jgi:hypothetical protein
MKQLLKELEELKREKKTSKESDGAGTRIAKPVRRGVLTSL